MADKKTKDETEILAAGVLAKHIVRTASDDASGNGFMHMNEIKKFATDPINLAYADITSETIANNLIDGQQYKITGFPMFSSGIQLDDIYVFAHLDNATGFSAILDNVCIANMTDGVIRSQLTMSYDWYLSQVLWIKDYYGNHIEGDANCNTFLFGTYSNNQIGKNFILDFTVPPTTFNNNRGLGSGTLTTSARTYENIDLDKGYFLTYGNITQLGTGVDPTIVVFKNETGGTLTPVYDFPGQYRLTCSIASFGASASDAWLHVGNTPLAFDANTAITWAADSRVDFFCGQFGAGQDDLFLDTPFEMRIKIS